VNGRNAMYLHSCHEPRIMRRFAGNPVLDDKAFPYRINGRGVGHNAEKIFQPRQFDRGLFYVHAQTVVDCGLVATTPISMRFCGVRKSSFPSAVSILIAALAF
jgi:hypothetical protein